MEKITELSSGRDLCRFLRAKNGYGTIEGGGAPFILNDSVTTSYRCICTGEPFGPNYQLAHPQDCKSSRDCFAPQEDIDETAHDN